MSGLAPVIFPPLELEHVDLGFLAVADDLAGDLGALHQRRSSLDGLPVGREEDLLEGHLRAGLGIHQREPKCLALFGLELFAAGPDDRVHALYLVRMSPEISP